MFVFISDKADVLQELSLAIEEDPEDETDQSGNTESRGVVTQPGKVECNLDAKVLRYFI